MNLGFEHIHVPLWDPSCSQAGGELPRTVQSYILRSEPLGGHSLVDSMGEGARRKTLISEVPPTEPLMLEEEETRAPAHIVMASDPMGWLSHPGMGGGEALIATISCEQLADISQSRTWGGTPCAC